MFCLVHRVVIVDFRIVFISGGLQDSLQLSCALHSATERASSVHMPLSAMRSSNNICQVPQRETANWEIISLNKLALSEAALMSLQLAIIYRTLQFSFSKVQSHICCFKYDSKLNWYTCKEKLCLWLLMSNCQAYQRNPFFRQFRVVPAVPLWQQ